MSLDLTLSCEPPHLCNPDYFVGLLSSQQENQKTPDSKSTANDERPHTREPRHPWDRFCGFPPIPGALASVGADGDGITGLQVVV